MLHLKTTEFQKLEMAKSMKVRCYENEMIKIEVSSIVN